MKKIELTLKDTESNYSKTFNLERSESGAPNNMNDFILDLLKIAEEYRKLPLKIYYPNGIGTYPEIKMQFDGHGSSLLGDNLVAMVIVP